MRVLPILILLTIGFAAKAQNKPVNTSAASNANESILSTYGDVQVSENFYDPNCQVRSGQNVQVINTTIVGNTAACLDVTATESIEINDFFDSESGSYFDAKIVGSINNPTDPTPTDPTPTDPTPTDPTPTDPTPTDPTPTDPTPIDPTPPVVVVPDEQKQCEDFSNHGPANPHIYGLTRANMYVGDAVSFYTPEYKVEGMTDWKLASTVPLNIPGTEKKYHYFGEVSDGVPRNIWLRTKAGCPEFRDIRNTVIKPNTIEDWTSRLPQNLPNYMNLVPQDFYLMANSEMEDRLVNDEIGVYGLYTDRLVSGLAAKVNGFYWMQFNPMHPLAPLFRVRDATNMMETPGFPSTKDFVLDLSTDNFVTGARYNVYRNYQGGHWTAVTTFTRHDGKVTVSAQGVSWEVDQILVNVATGQEFRNISKFGNVFDLGYLGDGTYEFKVKTYTGVLLPHHIVVKVRKPSI